MATMPNTAEVTNIDPAIRPSLLPVLWRRTSSPIAVLRVPATPETLNGSVPGLSQVQALGLEVALAAKRLERMPGVSAASPNYVRSIQVTPNDRFFEPTTWLVY